MQQFLMEYLVNSLWQIPLLAAGAWLLLRALRPSPRAQHLTWIAVLPLALALPLLLLRADIVTQVPRLHVGPGTDEFPVTRAPFVPYAIQPARTPHSSQRSRDLGNALADATMPDQPEFKPSASPRPASVAHHLPSTREFRLSLSATHWLAIFYLTTIAFALIRLLNSWRTARSVIAHAAHAVLSPSQSRLLDQCCLRMGVARPSVVESPRAHSPMVVGFPRPSLLLPLGFALGDAADNPRELEAVWLHELAHLRRQDSLAHLVCRLLALPLAYHPVTWVVEQRIRQTREMLCDAMAAAEMHSPASYARCLVTLARNLQITNGIPAQLDGAALFNGKSLEERVMQLVETRSTVNPRTRTMRLACAVAVILAVTAAAAIFHVTPTLAQTPVTTSPIAAPAQPTTAAESAPAATSSPTPDPDHARQAEQAANRQFAEGIRIISNAIGLATDRVARTHDAAQQATAATKGWQDALHRSIDASARQSVDMQMLASQADFQSAEVERRITDAKAKFDSPEFKAKMKQLDNPEFKKQIEEATAKFNSPEFKKQIEEAAAKFNSLELKTKMEQLDSPEFKKQLADATVKFDDPEFKVKMKQLDTSDLRKQMADLRIELDSPEFRKQIDAANNPEFRKQMEEMNRTIREQMQKIRQQMENMRQQLRDHASDLPSGAASPNVP
jgi:beta-lactamase regulating signal transducer with metallopeptidase domain